MSQLHRSIAVIVMVAADATPKQLPRFMVMAEQERALTKVLRAGDIVFAFCVRQPDLPPGFRPGMPFPGGAGPSPGSAKRTSADDWPHWLPSMARGSKRR